MSEQIKKILNELRKGLNLIYGPRIKGLYLYGSYARRTQDEQSDVDILIVLDKWAERYGAEVDRTGQLISDLSLTHGISLSRVFVTEQEWRSGHSSFLTSIREDAIAA